MDTITLTGWLSSIPETLWGVIVGSVVTLTGSSINNRFEKRERQRERQANLRRDVYLPASDAVTGMVVALSRMADLNASDSDINNAAQAFGAALGRVQMVSSTETIKYVAELQRAVLRTQIALIKRRIPMMLRKSDIEIAEKQSQVAHGEQQRVNELMAEHHSAGSRDGQLWRTLEQRAESAQNNWKNAHLEWQRLTLAQSAEHVSLLREIVTHVGLLSRLQGAVLGAIRTELKSSDAAALIAGEIEKTSEMAAAELDSLIPLFETALVGIRRDVEAADQRRTYS